MAEQIAVHRRFVTTTDELLADMAGAVFGDCTATQSVELRIALHHLIQTRRLADAAERSALAQERQAVALETLARAIELGVVDGGRECSALRIRDLS